ncbi:hypothetical protein [Streptomyces sp. NPDC051636]|uniref:hypothetical protein n=1 Tax=Streptomyces sp. NPDC051636 TaxID=3365663 RepID=UPI0037A9E5E9
MSSSTTMLLLTVAAGLVLMVVAALLARKLGLRRLKFWSIEVESDSPASRDGDDESGRPSTSGTVKVQDSRFSGDVGDISGVKIVGSDADPASRPGRTGTGESA